MYFTNSIFIIPGSTYNLPTGHIFFVDQAASPADTELTLVVPGRVLNWDQLCAKYSCPPMHMSRPLFWKQWVATPEWFWLARQEKQCQARRANNNLYMCLSWYNPRRFFSVELCLLLFALCCQHPASERDKMKSLESTLLLQQQAKRFNAYF